MKTNPANFRPSSALNRTPNAKRIGPPDFEMPSMMSVDWGKLGVTPPGAGKTGAMPVTEPNNALVAGQPASESVTAWSARAAPKVLAESWVTYACAVPAPILVNVTPGSDGFVPGLNVIASGIRSPYPARCIAVTSNSLGSSVRPRYAIAD